jgi:hypothetical protein
MCCKYIYIKEGEKKHVVCIVKKQTESKGRRKENGCVVKKRRELMGLLLRLR